MEVAPLPAPLETPKEKISECFDLKQDKDIYKLKIEIINQDIIILNILDTKEILKEYEIKLTLQELKQIHKVFLILNSSQEFLDYIKVIIENKKLSIKKINENKITIEIIAEFLYKQNTIKIDLNKKQINFDLVAQDLYQKISIINENYKNIELKYEKTIEDNKNMNNKNIKLEKDIIKLKEENKNLKEENNNIKIKLNYLEETINKMKIQTNLTEKKIFNKSINSSIMKDDEFDMIKLEIEKTMNNKIKSLNKLYQATVDGFNNTNFHKKCDNISNTLILYKSVGNRRFGGFTSQPWCLQGGNILDKKCFLFSLDRKKIYSSKNNKYYYLACYESNGPSFEINGLYLIKINNYSINTDENNEDYKSIFYNEKNSLSEDGNYKGTQAQEYEVFEIIF